MDCQGRGIRDDSITGTEFSAFAYAVDADMRYVTYATGSRDKARLYLMDRDVDAATLEHEMKAFGMQ